jgi:uncharacterized protein (TIGR02246 family)
MSPDERAIRDVITTWMTASAAGDTPTVLSLMADDALFLVAGRAPFGKAEFAAGQAALAGYRIEGNSDVREVEISGNIAWVRAHLTVSMTPVAGGETNRRTGPTLTIFRRLADGRWVLARDANLLTAEAKR